MIAAVIAVEVGRGMSTEAQPHDHPCEQNDGEETDQHPAKAAPAAEARVDANGIRELVAEVLPREEEIDEEEYASDQHQLSASSERVESVHACPSFPVSAAVQGTLIHSLQTCKQIGAGFVTSGVGPRS
jgi:hypothetical protein